MNIDPSAWSKRYTTVLLAVSSFVLTLFLFNPARIYIGNFMEFSFLFHESLLFFLAVSLFLVPVLFAAVLLLSRRPERLRRAVSILCVTAFLVWFQSSILLWQYGVLNGKDIEWSTLTRYGLIDSIIWITLLAIAIFASNLVFRISRYMSLALIVVQLLSLSQLWITMPKDQSFRQQKSSADTLFLFSQHVNVIIVVLDTFQSDIFQDIIQEDADLKASFDGFTYFRNALAGSDGTSVSIPNMLTASNYDNTIPYLEFVRKSFLENSLPKTLKEYGFSVDLYPIFRYSIYDDFSDTPMSRKRLMDWGAFLREQAFLSDLALFRGSPHFVKQLIYNHQRWFLSGLLERLQDSEAKPTGVEGASPGSYNLKYSRELQNSRNLVRKNWDATFINKMIPLSGILKNRDAFKFYHLNGVHLQLVMNENLEYEPQLPTREAMKRQGTGVLKIAAILLERLKQMKVYDNSLIFIVGDHGSGLPVASINPSPGGRLNRSGPYKGYFRNFKSAGIPMILVKRMNATGGLKVSDAPVSLSDIPQTVVDELGLEAHFPGESMFRVKEGEERERIYRPFLGSQEGVVYLPPLYEYSVNGFSWDDASWRETGKVYYAKSR